MKKSDHKKVANVIQALEKVDIAISQAALFSVEPKEQSNIPDIINAGYFASFAEHNDGSGQKIELNGCCVAGEIASAILDVLQVKRKQLLAWLDRHGVDVES